jgi:peroxiredoxin
MTLDRRTLARYATVAAIVLVIGGLLVQRELLAGSTRDSGDVGLVDDTAVEVGSPAPDFVLESPAGEFIALSDFRGKTVVLNFWATWCPPCRAEMPDLQAAFEERQAADDLVVLAVDLQEGDGQVSDFVDEFALTFPVVIDRTGEVAQHYELLGLPGTFFIDRDGVLRGKSLGPVFGNLLPDGIEAADLAGAGEG